MSICNIPITNLMVIIFGSFFLDGYLVSCGSGSNRARSGGGTGK